MKGFAGLFLHSEEGRAFLIQVPGVSTSALSDSQVAELMNWYLRTYSAPQLPQDFVPYTAEEVGNLRKTPVQDPASARAKILLDLGARLRLQTPAT